MPIIAGQQSKFAVLKIDDDSSSSSEDDGKRLIKKTSTKGRASGGSKKAGGDSAAAKSGLVVHVIPQKPKQKGKKAKKAQSQVLDSNGFIVQDAEEDYAERKFREDLREALKMSVDISGPPSSISQQQSSVMSETSTSKEAASTEKSTSNESVVKDPAEALIVDLDQQATNIVTGKTKAQGNREKYLMSIYRNRLLETLAQLGIQTEAFAKADSEAKKYRNRYKRICELLKDAEVNEKAHMAAELEKAHKVENELGGQIGVLQGELMQARSRIHELEAKVRQLENKH